MTAPTLSDGALRSIVDELRRRDPRARAIAVYASRWDGKPLIALPSGEQLPVHWCRSVLELRERLASADGPLVLLTDRDERELGEDVLALVARQRLIRIGLWEPVRAQFHATMLAPELRRLSWLADALIRHLPAGGYPPAPAGVLTADHAWSALLRQLFGVDAPPDAAELLVRVDDGSVATRLRAEPPERHAMADRVADSAGAAAEPILAATAAGHGAHAIAIGLVARAVFAEPEEDEQARALGQAAGRLERYLGGTRLGREAGLAWAVGAEQAVARAGEDTVERWLRDAATVLAEVGAQTAVVHSDVLPEGFDVRLERTGRTLAAWLDDDTSDLAQAVETAVSRLHAHRRARREAERIEMIDMAVRLVRWLHGPPDSEPMSFGEAAEWHARTGAWIDLARDSLDRREPLGVLSNALTELAQRVDERRRRRSLVFARLLAAATAAAREEGVIPVERALSQVVAPLAQATRVLIVVLDGASEAVFAALGPALERAAWRPVSREGRPRVPMLAALPSITHVSRASLLTGTLREGNQSAEREGFDAALRPVGAARLFHKADVAARGELEAAIMDERTRVVGVIVNAIDDRLGRGEQIAVKWSLETIEPLRWLLDTAAGAGRALVIAADHGHVLERGSEHRTVAGAASRFRPADGVPPAVDEVLISGPRVVSEANRIIVPAVEGLRYGPRAAGYHGGATPQEMIVPLAIFLPGLHTIEGLEDAPLAAPAWWSGTAERVPSPPSTAPRARSVPQPALFEPEASTRGEFAPAPAWIGTLLRSSAYAAQRARVSRAPADDRVATVLAALDRGGGVVSEQAIGAAAGVALLRVRPLLASIQQLVNLDGYQVLRHDAASGEVRLDRSLLERQFEL